MGWEKAATIGCDLPSVPGRARARTTVVTGLMCRFPLFMAWWSWPKAGGCTQWWSPATSPALPTSSPDSCLAPGEQRQFRTSALKPSFSCTSSNSWGPSATSDWSWPRDIMPLTSEGSPQKSFSCSWQILGAHGRLALWTEQKWN